MTPCVQYPGVMHQNAGCQPWYTLRARPTVTWHAPPLHWIPLVSAAPVRFFSAETRARRQETELSLKKIRCVPRERGTRGAPHQPGLWCASVEKPRKLENIKAEGDFYNSAGEASEMIPRAGSSVSVMQLPPLLDDRVLLLFSHYEEHQCNWGGNAPAAPLACTAPAGAHVLRELDEPMQRGCLFQFS